MFCIHMKRNPSGQWRRTPLIPALRRQRQASLVYINALQDSKVYTHIHTEQISKMLVSVPRMTTVMVHRCRHP